MGQFDGKVVLVTGASSGIGRAAAQKLALAGADVIAAARREGQGEEVARDIRSKGGRARFVRCDIADSDSVDELFAVIERDYRELDAAFNNAGIEDDPALLKDSTSDAFERVFAVNVRGPWLCMRHELRIMSKQGHGAIVNTSSLAGVVAFPRAAIYTASKHAVVGLTRSASLDHADIGVRVNCLCPGSTRTEMSERWLERVPNAEEIAKLTIPMKRMGSADELADAALWLLSDASSYVTGAVLTVDGGYSIV